MTVVVTVMIKDRKVRATLRHPSARPAPPLPAGSAGRDVSTLLSHGRPEWQRPRVEGALQAPLTAGGHCGDPSHGRAAVGLSPVGGHPRVGTPLLAAVSPRRLRSGKRSASLG